jgi:hypothetical protein
MKPYRIYSFDNTHNYMFRVEDILDKSEDFDQFDDLPPFSVNIDSSILLSKEDAITTKGRSSKGRLSMFH